MFDFRAITIVSGGQTGADRAALDFALEHGMKHSGWCPRGRIAEDGEIPPRYELRETPSRRYSQRTEWNVRVSDATVAFTIAAQLAGGTALTISYAERLGKPSLHLSRDALAISHGDAGAVNEAASRLLSFLHEHQIRTLNVAGPRASQEPLVADFVHDVLRQAFIS
ncbi:MAG: putative molybdenum carrier protein [Planctomycetes bacterium]|nr:putative molybdenum carrier protein [Planctomycetota bacterium]